MNQGQQDELLQLFAKQLTFEPQPQQQQEEQRPAHFQHLPSEADKQQPIHYPSSHYTGTAHLQPATHSFRSPSHSPPPPYNLSLVSSHPADILRAHSIDPASLLPGQLLLFTHAASDQRLRLLQLWRLSPPSYLSERLCSASSAGEQVTSVEQEEREAKAQYDEEQQQRQRQSESLHIISEPISPIREPGDPPWPPSARLRAASIAASTNHAEPYMAAGYQQQALSANAMDPVYAAAAGLWQAPSYADAMEDQYGAWDQIRNHADWERRNEGLARSGGVRRG